MSFVSRGVKPYFEKSVEPIVDFISQRGIHPNLITLSGLILVALGSLALYSELNVLALLFLGAGALLDAVDGAVARRMELQSDFGAFLDSTVDRFSDSLPFIALGALYAQMGEVAGVLLAFLSLVGSYGVSYTRARAESLGVFGIGGLFERTERWIVLLVGIAVDLIPLALLIIAVGSFATTLQRVYEVKKALEGRFL